MDTRARDELLARAYPSGGSTVTNCVAHMGLDMQKRPDDCRLCQADIRNLLSRALAANKWLNEWKEDAVKLIAADTA